MFAVPDPSSARVGSGGATFNALVTVQELVSASMDIKDCLVICIHSGGDSQRMYTQSVRCPAPPTHPHTPFCAPRPQHSLNSHPKPTPHPPIKLRRCAARPGPRCRRCLALTASWTRPLTCC